MHTQHKIILALLVLIGGFAACADQRTPEEIKQSQIRNRCRSKVYGSSPSCWNDNDWKAFCQRVQCKSQGVSNEK